MTITEGLVELKLLGSRIEKELKDTQFAGTLPNDKKGTEVEINFVEKAKASYQSITDLIKRRDAIKRAIVKANAVTTLAIGGATMTIAEAIEKKESIAYSRRLLAKIKEDYAIARHAYDRSTENAKARLDQLLSTMLSKGDSANMADAVKAVTDSFMEKNGVTLCDPIKAEDEIARLEKQIDEFMANVDTALSIVNAKTEIDIQ